MMTNISKIFKFENSCYEYLNVEIDNKYVKVFKPCFNAKALNILIESRKNIIYEFVSLSKGINCAIFTNKGALLNINNDISYYSHSNIFNIKENAFLLIPIYLTNIDDLKETINKINEKLNKFHEEKMEDYIELIQILKRVFKGFDEQRSHSLNKTRKKYIGSMNNKLFKLQKLIENIIKDV